MCSVFEFLDMDNFQGDLTDILRGTAGGGGGGGGGHVSSSPGPPETIWPPPPPPPPPQQPPRRSDLFPFAGFGDPFVNMNDPLLQELTSGYFSGGGGGATGDTISSTSSSSCSNNNNNNSNNSNNNNNSFLVPKVFEDDHIKNQCSVFPRIRISQRNIIHEASPCNSPVVSAAASPPGIIGRASVVVGSDMINVVDTTNSPRNCLMDNNNINTSSSHLQISSPRNLGLKRRKSQAKKVVCIPAPAAANSRSSGEVVPSDLWAWRKYGQKPIKGSPYPRGYYRCSSSKGCSARKQVERSRTDPNMLVITYTSEHNHPWPTQRNALAGSTRSSPHSSTSKPSTSTSTAATSSRTPHNTTKDVEPMKPHHDTHLLPTANAAAQNAAVKEEIRDERQDMEDDHPYRPEFHHNNNSEDFFADLDELEGDDPLSMLLSRGLGSGHVTGDGDRKNKTAAASDTFGDFYFVDWSVSQSNRDVDEDKTTSVEDRDDSNSKSL